MKILALDTSTEACSAALHINGNIISRFMFAPRKHTEILLPMVDEILAEADVSPTDIDGIAFCRGPGAFTGVRITAGIVQGMAFALNCPVVAISSLAALALGASRTTGVNNVISAIDARMNEMYWASFTVSNDTLQLIGEELLVSAELAPFAFTSAPNQTVLIAGTGWTAYASELSSREAFSMVKGNGEIYPDAQDVLTLALPDFEQGRVITAEQISPVYLRDKVV